MGAVYKRLKCMLIMYIIISICFSTAATISTNNFMLSDIWSIGSEITYEKSFLFERYEVMNEPLGWEYFCQGSFSFKEQTNEAKIIFLQNETKIKNEWLVINKTVIIEYNTSFVYSFNLTTNDKFQLNFNMIEGFVDFKVFNKENYLQFNETGTEVTEISECNITNLIYEFIPSSNDTYFFVWEINPKCVSPRIDVFIQATWVLPQTNRHNTIEIDPITLNTKTNYPFDLLGMDTSTWTEEMTVKLWKKKDSNEIFTIQDTEIIKVNINYIDREIICWKLVHKTQMGGSLTISGTKVSSYEKWSVWKDKETGITIKSIFFSSLHYDEQVASITNETYFVNSIKEIENVYINSASISFTVIIGFIVLAIHRKRRTCIQND